MHDPAAPLSAGVLVFGDQSRATAALYDAIRSGPAGQIVWSALGALAPKMADAAAQEIATVAAGLLDLDLAQVLISGWQKSSALAQTARRSVDAPGSRERVELVTHTVSAEQPLSVEVLLDGARVATITLKLAVQWTVNALTGIVVTGRLVAFESGHCRASVTITVEDVTVANRAVDADLAFVIPLGNGIPLVREVPMARPAGFADAGGTVLPPTRYG